MKSFSLCIFITFLLLTQTTSKKIKQISPYLASSLSSSFEETHWEGKVTYFKHVTGEASRPFNFIPNKKYSNYDPSCRNCFHLTVNNKGLYFMAAESTLLHDVWLTKHIWHPHENSSIEPIENWGTFKEGFCLSIIESHNLANRNRVLKWGICLQNELKKNAWFHILNNIIKMQNDSTALKNTEMSKHSIHKEYFDRSSLKPTIIENNNNNSERYYNNNNTVEPCRDRDITVIYKGLQTRLVLTRNTLSSYDINNTELFSIKLRFVDLVPGIRGKQCCFTVKKTNTEEKYFLCSIRRGSESESECFDSFNNIRDEVRMYQRQCDLSLNDTLGEMGLPWEEVKWREKELKSKMIHMKDINFNWDGSDEQGECNDNKVNYIKAVTW